MNGSDGKDDKTEGQGSGQQPVGSEPPEPLTLEDLDLTPTTREKTQDERYVARMLREQRAMDRFAGVHAYRAAADHLRDTAGYQMARMAHESRQLQRAAGIAGGVAGALREAGLFEHWRRSAAAVLAERMSEMARIEASAAASTAAAAGFLAAERSASLSQALGAIGRTDRIFIENSPALRALTTLAAVIPSVWMTGKDKSLGSLVSLSYEAVRRFGGSAAFEEGLEPDDLLKAAEAAICAAATEQTEAGDEAAAVTAEVIDRVGRELDERHPTWLARTLLALDPKTPAGRTQLIALIALLLQITLQAWGTTADSIEIATALKPDPVGEQRPATAGDLERMKADLVGRLVTSIEEAVKALRPEGVTWRRTPAYAPEPGRRRLLRWIPKGQRLEIVASVGDWSVVAIPDASTGVVREYRVRAKDLQPLPRSTGGQALERIRDVPDEKKTELLRNGKRGEPESEHPAALSRRERDARDLEIMNRHADTMNAEADDLLDYQTEP